MEEWPAPRNPNVLDGQPTADGTALCPNLRPCLPHKFQIVKNNGKDFL
jgi:hypothetical protein